MIRTSVKPKAARLGRKESVAGVLKGTAVPFPGAQPERSEGEHMGFLYSYIGE